MIIKLNKKVLILGTVASLLLLYFCFVSFGLKERIPLALQGNTPIPLYVAARLDTLWNYVYTMQYKCKKSEYLGGDPKMKNDGAYDLCTEEKFWPLSTNKDYKCLMYSFGVGFDFSFDDEIARKGCEVHSFDPSMPYEDGMHRASGLTFHKTGISDADLDRDANGWKMRTLRTILKEMQHSGRYLDYLKVDTDAPGNRGGFEDVLLQELLDTGLHKCVRQFAMEIHLAGPLSKPKWADRVDRIYRQLLGLRDAGWKIYNTTDNIRWNYDVGYTQLMGKKKILNGDGIVLWEVAMVNTADV
uniref:Methyltransferase domain-containing protein n=1 Tax=Ciona savignyi TaxID=51511 RepID=H2ZNW7_CIOSA